MANLNGAIKTGGEWRSEPVKIAFVYLGRARKLVTYSRAATGKLNEELGCKGEKADDGNH